MSEYKTNNNTRNQPSVLITGGSGLIGRYLTSLLMAQGYNVSHLSRKKTNGGKVRSFQWDPQKRSVDPGAFNDIEYIVHLAGANIGEKRWTNRRKKEILESRVNSARFLYETILSRDISLKGFISASASGIYGSEISQKIFNESDPPSDDFLGSVCRSWEESADQFSMSGMRTVKIRSGIVLEKSDSALSKLMITGKLGFLVQTGNGSQYMPWIHISDLCNIYLKAIEDPLMKGVYNAVASQHVTHRDFMKVLGKVLNIPVFPIPVPEFAIRGVLGEMSDIILKGSRVSNEKIINSGYRFKFGSLEDALSDVLLPMP